MNLDNKSPLFGLPLIPTLPQVPQLTSTPDVTKPGPVADETTKSKSNKKKAKKEKIPIITSKVNRVLGDI